MTDATLTIEPRPLAERLRIRKGRTLRWTGFDGKPQDFRVTYVSMPDAQGRCEVRCESVETGGPSEGSDYWLSVNDREDRP